MQNTDLLDRKTALFLDFDGTLVDLPNGDQGIAVDPLLAETIERIMADKLAPIAIVTGRKISAIDSLLQLPHLPVSGNHGTEIRLPGSSEIIRHAPPLPTTLHLSLQSICREFGCEFEDKIETASIHAPNNASFFAAKNDLESLILSQFKTYSLWSIGCSVEIYHAAYSKVTGIKELMHHDVFKKHRPVYIGDDAGTYPAIGLLAEKKVCLLPVGPEEKNGFRSPQDVRNFLVEFSRQHSKQDSSLASLFCEFGFLYRGL